jgi:dipeptidyl-peptidase-4
LKILVFLLFPILLFAQQAKPLTISDATFMNPDFRAKTVRGIQWTPDGNGYVYLKTNNKTRKQDIIYYDIASGKEDVYIDSNDDILEASKRAKRFTLKNFFWSPANQNIILVPKKNDLYLYEKESKKLTQLTFDELEERDPTFSPDGKKIAYLKNNNLFVLDIKTKVEKQLTKQGTEKILIGRFDWVYEEEFSIRTGFFWSPNSDKVAYFELTDAKTDRFPIVDFIPVKNDVEWLPYPKAGADNSTIRIGVVDVNASPEKPFFSFLSDKKVFVPKSAFMEVSSNKDELIPRIKWTKNNNKLAIIKMNRDQDYLDLFFADTKTGKAKKIIHEEEKNGWINIYDDWKFLNDGSFLWLSRKDGYKHIYLYDANGKEKAQLTKGLWEVDHLVGVDEKSQTIYFSAAKNSPLEREFYKTTFDGKKIVPISAEKGTHAINLSPNNIYFLDYFSNIKTPLSVDIKKTDGSFVRNLRKNTKDVEKKYTLGKKELVSFTTSDGVEIYGYMIKPYNFDESKKYPVLMYQYQGPGSQSVQNSYSFGRDLWHHYLSQEGIIVFVADGRGTGMRGREFEQITNHNLGKYEAKDQLEATKYLRSLPYIQKNKIGIWGWSYGGYMAALTVMKYPDAFNLAISVAPVTNWKNYDTIYTERFMSTPANNPNYDKGAPMHYVHQLKSPFMLIHGTADDNVHLSNAVQLVSELIKNKKQFEMFFYPRSQHGMNYDFTNTYPHLYTMMTNFVLKHLKER